MELMVIWVSSSSHAVLKPLQCVTTRGCACCICANSHYPEPCTSSCTGNMRSRFRICLQVESLYKSRQNGGPSCSSPEACALPLHAPWRPRLYAWQSGDQQKLHPLVSASWFCQRQNCQDSNMVEYLRRERCSVLEQPCRIRTSGSSTSAIQSPMI